MVTYEEARTIVRSATEPGWAHGTYCLDDRYITENDAMYVFTVGPRELLVGGDEAYRVCGGMIPVVYKETGQCKWLAAIVVVPDPSIRTRPNPSPTLVV